MLDEVAVMIGKRLREKRKAAGLTHAVVAEAIGKSDNYISKIECGKITPSIKSLSKIAALLGVHLIYFFEWDESGIDDDTTDTTEQALVALYRRLEPDQQDAFYRFIAANYPIFAAMRFS